MTPDPDTRPPLDPTALEGLPAPFRVEVHPSLASTSTLAAELARTGEPEGLVVVAEHQTDGRGRLDRTWITPPRAVLTFSILLRPGVPAERWTLLPLLTGVAVVEGLAAAGGPPVMLKWPNDVLSHDGLKVAGLLLERVDTSQGAAAVVGVGLNVSTTRAELPSETAGSLVTAGMVAPDRTRLLHGLLAVFADRYRWWRAAGGDGGGEGDPDQLDRSLLETYAQRCDTLGREVRVHLPGDRTLHGRATGLDRHGALVVENQHGRHSVHAGDVVHVRVP